MKLRLRENSIRLRLLQTEVERLRETGSVSETITLGVKPTEHLIYALRISFEAENVHAQMLDNRIEIFLPARAAEVWMNGDEETGIYAIQSIDIDLDLQISVEKDFKCATRPSDRDNADAFPSPEKIC